MAFCTCCNRKRPGHAGILSYNDMKIVMWDLTQADEYAQVFLTKDTTKNKRLEISKLYQEVFTLHHLDSARFFNSFDYYKKHPDDYKVLIDSLAALATREREKRLFQNRINTPAGKEP
jgi:hypothetical protein